MGGYAYYFILKLALYAGEYMGFHFWWNLAFALALTWPVRKRALRIARHAIAVPCAMALMWYDSWLPPFKRVLAQRNDVMQFDWSYLTELIGRFIDLYVVLGLAGLFLASWLLAHRLRLSSFALAAILAVPLAMNAPKWMARPTAVAATGTAQARPGVDVGATVDAAVDPDQALEAFYAAERRRRAGFAPGSASAAPFDIVLLHVCSLAWDDIDFAGRRDHPFLKRFTLRFDNFNSAASYSGPAAIRILRASCGQTPHSELYKAPPPECFLFEGLDQAGFEPRAALNHDGRFGDFLKVLSDQGGLRAPPFDNRALPVTMKAFDGAPLRGDYDVLAAWWKQRLDDPAPQVALYYNTATLHDGNRIAGRERLSVQESYRVRLDAMFDDFIRFLDLLESSGRRVVVAMVPEHGAAARGDRMQISGLREIPSPAVSLVPAGVTLVGAGTQAMQIESGPTSHLAVSTLFARMAADNPFLQTPPGLGALAQGLPQTQMVAENEGTVVMRRGNGYVMRSPDGQWTEYVD